MYLGTNLDNVFYEYTVTMTEEERMQDELISSASELRLGINLNDPSIVSHIANDSAYLNKLGRNWMCEDYCPYKRPCLQLRAGELVNPLVVHLPSTGICRV